MVRVLLGLIAGLRRAWLFELVGAGLVAVAVFLLAGPAWCMAACGVFLLLKAFEIDGSP